MMKLLHKPRIDAIETSGPDSTGNPRTASRFWAEGLVDEVP